MEKEAEMDILIDLICILAVVVAMAIPCLLGWSFARKNRVLEERNKELVDKVRALRWGIYEIRACCEKVLDE